MERESFESRPSPPSSTTTSCIKVELREGNPDVDRIYMLFVPTPPPAAEKQPMSVWLTPELKPFYGGTYFPPISAVPSNPASRTCWRSSRRPGANSAARSSTQPVIWPNWKATPEVTAGVDGGIPAGISNPASTTCAIPYDKHYGGFGNAPKFPRPVVLNFLFRYFHVTGDEDTTTWRFHALRAMADGGMHDQMGGGFHRYSVDEHWFVPYAERCSTVKAHLTLPGGLPDHAR